MMIIVVGVTLIFEAPATSRQRPCHQDRIHMGVDVFARRLDPVQGLANFLALCQVDLGLTQSEEIRQALGGIKAAGKEVYAHVDCGSDDAVVGDGGRALGSASLPPRLSSSRALTPSRPMCGACWT